MINPCWTCQFLNNAKMGPCRWMVLTVFKGSNGGASQWRLHQCLKGGIPPPLEVIRSLKFGCDEALPAPNHLPVHGVSLA